MKQRLLFCIYNYLLGLFFFAIARLFFLVYHFKQLKSIPVADVVLSFVYGLMLDGSIVAYLCIIPFLLVIASVFNTRIVKVVYPYYALLVLIVCVILITIDVELFTAWGFRLDSTLFNYLASPKEAFVTSLSAPWLILLSTAIVLFIIFYKLYHKIFSGKFDFEAIHPLNALLYLVLTIALVVPIRGGFQLSPINESSAFFSKYSIINQATINCIWTLGHSVAESNYQKQNPYPYFEQSELKTIISQLQNERTSQHTQVLNTKLPNIIMVIWESGSAKMLDQFDNKEIAPYLKKLIKEGIYFSNCFAAGNRTEKGLAAILSGYPSLPNASIVMNPKKSVKLPSIIELLSKEGYQSKFIYGGEVEFANIKSFLLSSQIETIISKDDFQDEQLSSKWGAHDEFTFNRLLEESNKSSKPFFNILLTLSSHEPFDIPSKPLLEPIDRDRLYLNSIHYADSCLGDFVNKAKKQSWWQNTLMIVVADHGTYLPGHGLMEHAFNDYRIPFLMLGGAVQQSKLITHTISQLDIPNILLNQMDIADTAFCFGKNTLNKPPIPWAFYSFNDGFAAITDSSYYLHDNISNKALKNPNNASEEHIKRGKAFLQYSYQDYLAK